MPALRKRGPMHEINIVPYVDVMLVLLVIFMVTAPLVTPAVIDLPTVDKASQPRIVPLEVFVKADRGLVVRSRDTAGASARHDVLRLLPGHALARLDGEPADDRITSVDDSHGTSFVAARLPQTWLTTSRPCGRSDSGRWTERRVTLRGPRAA